MLGRRLAASAAVASFAAQQLVQAQSNPSGLSRQRDRDFNLTDHNHGKARVRVMKVRRAEDGTQSCSEFTVHTKLFSPEYTRVFTDEDNTGLVATDTQKNTVYVVAKRTPAELHSCRRAGLGLRAVAR